MGAAQEGAWQAQLRHILVCYPSEGLHMASQTLTGGSHCAAYILVVGRTVDILASKPRPCSCQLDLSEAAAVRTNFFTRPLGCMIL